MLLDKQRQRRIPRAPTQEQVVDTLNFLWHPFKRIPLCLAYRSVSSAIWLVDRGCSTAVAHGPGLPACSTDRWQWQDLAHQMHCELDGHGQPCNDAASDNEEEIRKRVLAALREGKSTLVFDNVVGHFDSATLCALLTTPRYSDRLLGSSATVTVPTNALFMASGTMFSSWAT